MAVFQNDGRAAEFRDYRGRILYLTECKTAGFERYLALTRQLQALTPEDALHRMPALMAERRRCIAAINRMDEDVAETVRSWKGPAVSVGETVRELLGAAGRDLQARLASIQRMEADLLTRVDAERQRLKDELLKLRRSRNGVRGYGRPKSAGAKFLSVSR